MYQSSSIKFRKQEIWLHNAKMQQNIDGVTKTEKFEYLITRINPASTCSIHQMYSSSVSPFHAYTGTPVFAMAAAAKSWVEKMLQLLHWT